MTQIPPNPIRIIARKYLSHGRVQGVGYRQFVCDIARELSLRGTVRNLSTGAVETLVCGSAEVLAKLFIQLKKGPPSAAVTSVETLLYEGPDVERWQGFTVRF